jgi:hypothetical protein
LSFRGRRIPRLHENDKASKISTIENTQQLLRILLKEISECPNKQEHIEGLRHAIINEEITATASEILEHEAREELLK